MMRTGVQLRPAAAEVQVLVQDADSLDAVHPPQVQLRAGRPGCAASGSLGLGMRFCRRLGGLLSTNRPRLGLAFSFRMPACRLVACRPCCTARTVARVPSLRSSTTSPTRMATASVPGGGRLSRFAASLSSRLVQRAAQLGTGLALSPRKIRALLQLLAHLGAAPPGHLVRRRPGVFDDLVGLRPSHFDCLFPLLAGSARSTPRTSASAAASQPGGAPVSASGVLHLLALLLQLGRAHLQSLGRSRVSVSLACFRIVSDRPRRREMAKALDLPGTPMSSR